jgi:hypothetical protein
MHKSCLNGSPSNNKFEENGETVNDLSLNGLKRTFGEYVKIYKPAQKVKRINYNSREIEIYFSEKSVNEQEMENGKAQKNDDYLREFERNYSRNKLQNLTIVRTLN